MFNQRRPAFAVACVVLCVLAQPWNVRAQLADATLKGSVVDSNGNVVASSPVVARNESTGESRTTTTDEGGYFTIPTIPAGTYTVSVRADGFKTYEQRSIKLSVGQTTELQVRLEVGEVHGSWRLPPTTT